MPQAEQVQTMFDSIAGRYDLMNRVMTMGIDRRWRDAAVREALLGDAAQVLDVCCGTGDIAFALARAGAAEVTGLDFSRGMLDQAEIRAAALDLNDPAAHVTFVEGDALALPFPDDSFDAVTVSFGVRNVESVPGAFAEFARVLRPGGRAVCLEITRPQRRAFKRFYELWFDRIVPRIGAAVARNKDAYTYLPESTKQFPPPEALRAIMQEAGFTDVRYRLFGGGIVALHSGVTATAASGNDTAEAATAASGVG